MQDNLGQRLYCQWSGKRRSHIHLQVCFSRELMGEKLSWNAVMSHSQPKTQGLQVRKQDSIFAQRFSDYRHSTGIHPTLCLWGMATL